MNRLLIVDDHPSFRAIARAALAGAFEVIGEAGDGQTALALAHELRPEIVLLDIQLPDLDGFAVASDLVRQDDRVAVILTSSRNLSDFGPALDGSRARGFIPKDQLSAQALKALLQ